MSKPNGRSTLTRALLAASSLAFAIPAWARDYVGDGRAAMDKGDYKTALIQLRNAVRDKPEDGEARFLLARVDLSIGDPVAGEKEARASRDLGYNEAASILLLGEAYLAQGKIEPLLKDFTTAGKDPKADAATQVMRGYALIAERKLPEAQAAIDSAEHAAPDMIEPKLAQSRLALARGNLDAADAQVGAALKIDPSSTEALLQKAQVQRLRQDPKGAVATLDTLLAAQPGAVGARLERATLLTAMGEDARAKEDVAAVQAIVPNSVQALYLQANLLTRQKDYAAADGLLTKLEPALGTLPRGFLLQAGVKEALGQMEQAREAAQKYAACSPADIEGARMLARLELERRNPDPVIAALEPLRKAGTADPGLLEMLGRAYAQVGRAADAQDAVAAAIQKAPDNAGLHAELGALKAGAGDQAGAQAELSRALALNPKSPAIAEQLYAAAIASGDLPAADKAVAAVQAAQPGSPVSANLQGLMQLQRLDYDGARKTFEALSAAHPDFAPAKINLARIAALQGRDADEATILDAQLHADPAAEPALSMRLSDFVRTQRFDQAEIILKHALDASKDKAQPTARLAALYLSEKQPQKAIDTLGTLNAADRADPRVLAVTAEAYGAAGQKQETRDTLAKLVDKEPRDVTVRRQLAAQIMASGDAEQARTVIQAGLALEPRNLQLLQDLVSIDAKTGGLEAGLQTADRLIDQNKDFPMMRTLKGDTLMGAGKFDEADAAYADAERASPGAYFVIRRSEALMRGNKRPEAVTMLRDYVHAHPEDIQVAERLSEFDIADKDLPEAQALLETVLAREPRSSVALNNLAWVYQQTNDKRAEDTARRAFLLSPGGQTADTLGWILVRGGHAGDAMGLMRQASAEVPNDPRVQYHFAYALNAVGQKQDAITVLKPLVLDGVTFDEKPEAAKLLQTLTKGA